MYQLTMDLYQSAAVGALVLVLGLIIVKHSPELRKFCIPAAVVGGLLSSLILLLLHEGDVMEITFDETLKNVCMRAFFCSVGFMASFKLLKAGGRLVTIMVLLMVLLVLMQDTLGVLSVSLFDLDPKYGLALGSISLTGGHGTAAAYGKVLVEDYGLVGGDIVAIAAATFGLAIAGILGGPISERLVKKHNLEPSDTDIELSEEKEEPIKNDRFLKALILLVACMGAGTLVNYGFDSIGITLPTYLGALVLAIIVRNVADAIGYDIPEREIELLGWISLCLFLSMALMGMKLWQLADLAAAMVFTLALQTIALVLFVYFLVFRATGKSYDSAALVAGTTGFGMGATPNAVANVEALMQAHGPAPVAYFIVPIIGGVFLDLINVGVLTAFLNLL